MLNPFKKVSQFFKWWKSSLLSCLPEKWNKYLSDLKSNFKLIVMHQEYSVTLMTAQGKVLNSIPLSHSTGIDLENLPSDKKVISGFSDSELAGVANITPKLDPPLSLNPGSVDFELDDQTQELSTETLDLILGEAAPDKDNKKYDIRLFDHAEENNVVSLNIPKDRDSTLVLNDEDQTIRFSGITSDDDTIIIQNDQGNLLQFDTVNSGVRDSTILFRSEDGKIRRVEVDGLEASEFTQPDKNQDQEPGKDFSTDYAVEYKAVAELLEKYQGRKKCLYLLPEKKIFVLNLTYPIEAIQNIESVLRYDLEKHIPLSFQEIRYFYALNVNYSQNKVNAEVAVIKSDEFDLLNLSLEPFVKKGLFCTTEKFFEKYGNTINFLETKVEESWQSIFKFSSLHLGFNWVLLLVLLTLPFAMFYQGLGGIEKKSPEQINRVNNLVTSFNSINAEADFGSILSKQINSSPRSVALLSLLSGSINKQAWLARFSLKGNQIKIKGEADSATSVSDDLNRTGLFESIKFVSSIVKNAKSGKETFELLLVLKSDA